MIGYPFPLILTMPWHHYHLYLATFTQFDQGIMAIPDQSRTTWLLSSTLVTDLLSVDVSPHLSPVLLSIAEALMAYT